jgi:DNA-binding beta-propeller fold protein YncE
MIILALILQATQHPPQRNIADPGVIATNERITPAGIGSVFEGRVTGLRFGREAGEVWVAVPGSVFRMSWADNRVLARVPISGRAGIYGLARDPVTGGMLISSVGRMPAGAPRPAGIAANSPVIAQLAAITGDSLHSFGGFGHDMAGSPAIAKRANPSGHRVAVLPLSADDQLAVVDADSGTLLRTVPLGVAPIAAVVSADGAVAWITELAGQQPGASDRAAMQCCEQRAEPVRIDARGIAAPGTVVRVDLLTGEIDRRVTVGRHPTAIVWDEVHDRAYITDGNSDDIAVLDTDGDSLLGTVSIAPFGTHAIGLAPTAVALSPDAATLYVALGGVNAVAVFQLASTPRGMTLRGMIPTAWYPTTLDVSPDGRRLAVGTLLGVGSGTGTTVGMTGRYVHAVRGAVNVVDLPTPGQLAAFTLAVSQNNRLPLASSGAGTAVARRGVAPRAVPERTGEPSLITQVVYVIRENRTYDQVLGDLGRGDGDTSLVMYGRDVTPNSHALSEQFVTLDRLFASGGNSADGHQWLTQANETDYTLWPLYEGRSYPYDGTDPLAYSNGGFIWDAAAARHRSVAVFGEFAPEKNDSGAPGRSRLLEQYRARGAGGGAALRLPAFHTTSPIPSLDQVLVRDFPSWTLDIPDVARAEIFLAHLNEWQQRDSMPNLVILQLPSNHTAGTTEEWCTPKACVADNDLALGKVVDGLSHSKFWGRMAILVVEDDAQNGVDHVDGHRTVALAISPYTRRGAVDSTAYNHPSLLKTIELMLGLPALSIFDLAATDLGKSFIGPGERPDVTPFTAIQPGQSIYEVNPRASSLRGDRRAAALASARMRFDIPDAAPTGILNRILWHDARGWAAAYPAVKSALFFPMSLDVGDADRDSEERPGAGRRPAP